jgi:signal peptidase I
MGDERPRRPDEGSGEREVRAVTASGPLDPVGGGPDEPSGGQDEAPEGRRERRGSFLRELPVILVAALVLSLLIKSFLVQAFFIPSGSMEQTLAVGDRVFVNKLVTRFGDVERGDVVVFRDPADWLDDPPAPAEGTGQVREALRDGLEFVGLAPSSSGDDLIKRVIGVGGDRVACCDAEGRVTVNGVPLEEDYLFPGNDPSETTFDVEVPEGHLWVMGDHREQSLDSRAHIGEPGGGMLPEEDVVGRAFVVVWPFDRFKGLSRPDTFSRSGLDGG